MTATTICATDPALMEACRISASSKESLLAEAISRGTGCGADKTACPAIPADVVMGSIGMGCRCGPRTDEQSDIEAGDIPVSGCARAQYEVQNQGNHSKHEQQVD